MCDPIASADRRLGFLRTSPLFEDNLQTYNLDPGREMSAVFLHERSPLVHYEAHASLDPQV